MIDGMPAGSIADDQAIRLPVLARYHARLLAVAEFAGPGLVCGGIDPGRRGLVFYRLLELALPGRLRLWTRHGWRRWFSLAALMYGPWA